MNEEVGEAGIGSGNAGLAVAAPGAKNVTKLIKQGFKLAVLGCLEPTEEHPNAFRWWHVVKPGSYSIPQVGDKLTYGTSVCGKFVITNGYAADWRPPEGSLCPKCREQL